MFTTIKLSKTVRGSGLAEQESKGQSQGGHGRGGTIRSTATTMYSLQMMRLRLHFLNFRLASGPFLEEREAKNPSFTMIPEKNIKPLQRTITWSQLEPWQRDNPAILTGYRSLTNSWFQTFSTLLWWHNESGKLSILSGFPGADFDTQ